MGGRIRRNQEPCKIRIALSSHMKPSPEIIACLNPVCYMEISPTVGIEDRLELERVDPTFSSMIIVRSLSIQILA